MLSPQTKGFNYGFVEYDDPGAAERAMHTLNGRRIHNAVSSKYPKTSCKLLRVQNTGNSRELGLSIKYFQ